MDIPLNLLLSDDQNGSFVFEFLFELLVEIRVAGVKAECMVCGRCECQSMLDIGPTRLCRSPRRRVSAKFPRQPCIRTFTKEVSINQHPRSIPIHTTPHACWMGGYTCKYGSYVYKIYHAPPENVGCGCRVKLHGDYLRIFGFCAAD